MVWFDEGWDGTPLASDNECSAYCVPGRGWHVGIQWTTRDGPPKQVYPSFMYVIQDFHGLPAGTPTWVYSVNPNIEHPLRDHPTHVKPILCEVQVAGLRVTTEQIDGRTVIRVSRAGEPGEKGSGTCRQS